MDENIGRVDKKSIIRALQEAMTMGESGRTISEADRRRMERLKGMGKPQGMKMPERMKTKGRGDMDLSPEEEEALKMLLQMRRMKNQDAERKAFSPPSMMNGGGVAVAKKRKKPKKGCVMKGRGGSYKGIR